MMADCPGCPHPPTYSWNAGMVMHVLKSDLVFRDLKHVQVARSRRAYLFFFNKQGHRRLTTKASQAMQTHIREAFAECIFCSVHFAVNPIQLAEGWCHAVAASEWHRYQSWVEYQGLTIPALASGESDSIPQLMGSAPPSAGKVGSVEDNGEG